MAIRAKSMTCVPPNVLFGGKARYLQKYNGIGLERFASEALFVDPTGYFQMVWKLAADDRLKLP
jgi:hypothetical protein